MQENGRHDIPPEQDQDAVCPCLFLADGLCHNATTPHTGKNCPYAPARNAHCPKYKPHNKTPRNARPGINLSGLPAVDKLLNSNPRTDRGKS